MEKKGATNWTEISAAESLAGLTNNIFHIRQKNIGLIPPGYRASQENSRGTSFGTISAFGSNGAIIHYSPTPETDATITRYRGSYI